MHRFGERRGRVASRARDRLREHCRGGGSGLPGGGVARTGRGRAVANHDREAAVGCDLELERILVAAVHEAPVADRSRQRQVQLGPVMRARLGRRRSIVRHIRPRVTEAPPGPPKRPGAGAGA